MAKVFNVEPGEVFPTKPWVVSGSECCTWPSEVGLWLPKAHEMLRLWNLWRRLSYWGYKQEGVCQREGQKRAADWSRQFALLTARNRCPEQNGKNCSVCISGNPTHTQVSMPSSSLHSPQEITSHPRTEPPRQRRKQPGSQHQLHTLKAAWPQN